MIIDYIKNIISNLPSSPGVYQYFDEDGKIIYVGKAKNLKKRVSSYFTKRHDSTKVNILVKKIKNIEYIVVNSEEDALLLENNLIKKYQPRYNILLKDGKTYPWLCITKEEYPRIFKTRFIKRGAEYFGPYPSTYTLDVLLELIKEIYPIRTCKYPINAETIEQNRYNVCLQYHIKNCKGVCEGLQSQEDYASIVKEIKEIAHGNSHIISNYLLNQMKNLASQYKFEEAQEIKKKYDALLNYQAKTVITTVSDDNIDVFAYDEDENSAYINILHIIKGAVVQGFTVEYKKKLEETKEDILAIAIIELREKIKSSSTKIILPFSLDLKLKNIDFIEPQRGDKKKLLDLSMQNVRQYKLDKYKYSERLNPEHRSVMLLKNLQEKLNLSTLPTHIECFDNSNISGTDAVAACVVYKNGKSSRKDYRTFNIKNVIGPDDYASMQEVVKRRYNRLILENQAIPNLIITDGGKGQMSVVNKVVNEELKLGITIIGLVKDDKHSTSQILVGVPAKEVGIKHTDILFKFLASIQDEVHRVAITFHKNKRSKTQLKSKLDDIQGVGDKTKTLLLHKYKTVNRISLLSKEELINTLGKFRGSVVYDYFNK